MPQISNKHLCAIIPTRGRRHELSMALASLIDKDPVSAVVVVSEDDYSGDHMLMALKEAYRFNQKQLFFHKCLGREDWSVAEKRVIGSNIADKLGYKNALFFDDDQVMATDLTGFESILGEKLFLAFQCTGVYHPGTGDAEGFSDDLEPKEKFYSLDPHARNGLICLPYKEDFVAPTWCAQGGAMIMEIQMAIRLWTHAMLYPRNGPREDEAVCAAIAISRGEFGVFTSRYKAWHLQLPKDSQPRFRGQDDEAEKNHWRKAANAIFWGTFHCPEVALKTYKNV